MLCTNHNVVDQTVIITVPKIKKKEIYAIDLGKLTHSLPIHPFSTS